MSTLEYKGMSEAPPSSYTPNLFHQEGYQPSPQHPLLQAPPHYYPSPAELPVPQQQHTNNTVVVQQPGYNTYDHTRPNDYLGLSLFACLCCCWPIAIVALLHSCQVNDRYNAGDYAGAIDSSQKAKYWSKVAIIVGICMTAISAGVSVFSIWYQFSVAAGAGNDINDSYIE